MSIETTVLRDTDVTPTADQLVERARELIPMLRATAAEVEKARRVPTSTVRAFQEAGFFRILQPKRWGGWEMDVRVFYQVLMELGRGCGSSAWVMMILGIHQWEFGLFPEQAGDDVWRQDSSVIVASSYPPIARCRRVDGGWRISGRWPTSSGTDHAQWAILGGMVVDEEGTLIERLTLLVPRSDYSIEDDWHVFGLAGTGSKSLLVDDAFVPDHRTHTNFDQEIPWRSNRYRIPFKIAFYGAVSAAINGMASGAVDLYREQMSVRRTTGFGTPVNASPYVRDRLGNAVARVRSSRMRLMQLIEDALGWTEKGEEVPVDYLVHALVDIARVGRECEEAVLLLFKATSARGLFLDNPIQRVLRDVLAAANHITQNADDTAGMLGGYLLGQALPPNVFSRSTDSLAS